MKIIGLVKPYCKTLRKKFGNPTAEKTGGYYGECDYGESGFGSKNPDNNAEYYGIYQMRLCKEGRIPVRMKFYKQTYVSTPPLQANRVKFTEAVSAWKLLTEAQKKDYAINARGLLMNGWNLFISEKMKKK